MARKDSIKSSKPLVSVVVLNWNGKRFIDGFLKTLDQQNYPANRIELIFVDNNSSDDSVDYFRKSVEKTDFEVKYVLNDSNLGYAGGNNTGMMVSTGDYILVCNNDLEFEKNLISNLVSCAEQKNADVCVPKLMYLNKPGVINNAGSKIVKNSDWPIIEIGANEKDAGQYDETREISAFCGACVLFKRQFLEQIGLFDAKFFMYFEDGDLSWRGQKKDCHYFYEPSAVVNHIHTGSSTEGSPLFNHYVGRNRLLILIKNGSLIAICKAWLKTLRDHCLLRIKRIVLALFGKYSKRLALTEFWLSQKIIWSALIMSPYALAKRFGVIKEAKL